MKLPTQHATMPWGPASLAFFGIAFARVWLSFVFVEPAAASGALALPHDVFDWAFAGVSLLVAVCARRLVPFSAKGWAYGVVLAGAASGALALPHDVFDWAFAGVSLLVAVCARRLVPFSAKGWAYGVVLAGMLTSSACSIAGAFVAVPGPVALAGALVGGASYAGFLVLNAEVFAGVSLLRIVLYLSGSRLLASLMAYLLASVDTPRMVAVLVLMPCIAVTLLRSSYRTLPASDRQHAAYPEFSYPWKLLVLVGVFSFAYGLRQGALVAGAGQHSSFSTAIAMGAVFVLAYFFAGRIDVARLCRLPLPIMAFGLLLVPSSGLLGQVASSYLISIAYTLVTFTIGILFYECRLPLPIMAFGLLLVPSSGLLGQVASSYLISIAYTLVTFTIGILFYDMSKRTGVAIAPLIAAMNTMQICVVLGNYTTHALDALLPNPGVAHTVTTVLVCVALVVLFFLLFSERELSTRWGIRVLQGASLGEEAREGDRIASRCEELVKMYALTSREAEVLRELAQQKDNQTIAGNLLIAPGTLKAHTRHIYEKMGIHTRAELNGLLGIEGKTS